MLHMSWKEIKMSITRFDKTNNSRNVGWWVRVRRQGKLHSRLFSDSKYGGESEGLKIATQYEQDLIGTLPAPRGKRVMPNKNNACGVSKVYITNGSVVTYWNNEDDSRGKVSFSINYYGSIALTLAVLSYINKRRIDKCTKIAHQNIQAEYAANFPDLEKIRNQFIKD